MSLLDIFRKFIGEENFLICAAYLQKRKLIRYYSKKVYCHPAEKKTYVYMADGKIVHGGLADRLLAIMYLYDYCKKNDYIFKIYFHHPFKLTDYLLPNNVDWLISEEELFFDGRSCPIILKPTRKLNNEYNYRILGTSNHILQTHVYTYGLIGDYDAPFIFNNLFKPSEVLLNILNENIKNLGHSYVSITFRFQQLLGDFKEGNYKILCEKDRISLINKCLNVIEIIKAQNSKVNKILVTSDSKSFLSIAQNKFKYVYIIPGDLQHMDYGKDINNYAYIKSFVDLLCISKAYKSYTYITEHMYARTGFARTAALIGGVSYNIIRE